MLLTSCWPKAAWMRPARVGAALDSGAARPRGPAKERHGEVQLGLAVADPAIRPELDAAGLQRSLDRRQGRCLIVRWCLGLRQDDHRDMDTGQIGELTAAQPR
jgi:hypothetical protein